MKSVPGTSCYSGNYKCSFLIFSIRHCLRHQVREEVPHVLRAQVPHLLRNHLQEEVRALLRQGGESNFHLSLELILLPVWIWMSVLLRGEWTVSKPPPPLMVDVSHYVPLRYIVRHRATSPSPGGTKTNNSKNKKNKQKYGHIHFSLKMRFTKKA